MKNPHGKIWEDYVSVFGHGFDLGITRLGLSDVLSYIFALVFETESKDIKVGRLLVKWVELPRNTGASWRPWCIRPAAV